MYCVICKAYYELHVKLNFSAPTSARSGPGLSKPSSSACSTANYGLRTGLRCFFAANLTCLAGRAADCSYFKTVICDDLS